MAIGSGNAAISTQKSSIFQSLMDEINKTLASIEDRQTIIYNALSRLRNPRPQGVSPDTQKAPHADTIESALQQIQYRLQRIHEIAADQADDLNTVV